MISDSDVHWAGPRRAGGTGALVLSGSSGRLEVDRADLLGSYGVTALALRWFGGEGQPAVPREVSLETFTEAVGLLTAECGRIVLIGLSYGAEGALLTATVDDRVDGVVALAPTDVVWEGYRDGDEDPARSKWTYASRPVPFVPVDQTWQPAATRPAYVEHYEHSRALATPQVVEAATIPVERFGGELVLVAGGDDRVWPSSRAAERIAERRRRAGLDTVVVTDPLAGHPVVLPGETPPDPTRPYQVGGDDGAPERLGALAWPAIRRVLRIEH